MCSRLKWLLGETVGIQILTFPNQIFLCTTLLIVSFWLVKVTWLSRPFEYQSVYSWNVNMLVTKMSDYWAGNGCHSKSEPFGNSTLFYHVKIWLSWNLSMLASIWIFTAGGIKLVCQGEKIAKCQLKNNPNPEKFFIQLTSVTFIPSPFDPTVSYDFNCVVKKKQANIDRRCNQ